MDIIKDIFVRGGVKISDKSKSEWIKIGVLAEAKGKQFILLESAMLSPSLLLQLEAIPRQIICNLYDPQVATTSASISASGPKKNAVKAGNFNDFEDDIPF